MPTVKENLIAAKDLIADPAKWIKGKSSDGCGCFCIVGACCEVGAITAANLLDDLVSAEDFPDRGILRPAAAFNDDPATTHADVMSLFDRAIAAQEG